MIELSDKFEESFCSDHVLHFALWNRFDSVEERDCHMLLLLFLLPPKLEFISFRAEGASDFSRLPLGPARRCDNLMFRALIRT